MVDDQSVTGWITELSEGDREEAANQIWQRYCQKLIAIARFKMRGYPSADSDEEDVVLSAFASFCRGVEAGTFPVLQSRDNLWKLLVVITTRKAADALQSENRLKRSGGENAQKVPVTAPGIDEEILTQEPTPEFAAQLIEEYRRLLEILPDEELKQVAGWKMEGYTNDEIARKLDCASRTVERKLRVIRSLWSE